MDLSTPRFSLPYIIENRVVRFSAACCVSSLTHSTHRYAPLCYVFIHISAFHAPHFFGSLPNDPDADTNTRKMYGWYRPFIWWDLLILLSGNEICGAKNAFIQLAKHLHHFFLLFFFFIFAVNKITYRQWVVYVVWSSSGEKKGVCRRLCTNIFDILEFRYPILSHPSEIEMASRMLELILIMRCFDTQSETIAKVQCHQWSE